MTIIMSLMLIIVIFLTASVHLYFVWKKRDYRTLFTQIGVLGLAFVLGILCIWGYKEPSISEIFNTLSPFRK